MHSFRRTLGAALLVTLALLGPAAAKPPTAGPTPPLPVATPESQRMSSERLARGGAEIQRFLDEGKHAGAISLVVRNGKIVDWAAHGKRDLEAGLPMEKDTIVRIYSMSKIVTSVAALILLEEARFRLDDPIGEYLPELAHMKVLTGGTAGKPLLADAKRPITIKHLFAHTSGLTYDFGDSPVDKLNREAKLPEAPSLADFVVRVSRLPLAHEPGERFSYGVSTDILGALVEKVSGRSFGAFLEERLLRPLGMKDTGFSVSEAKLSRLAKIYEKGKDGKLQPAKPLFGIQPSPGPKLEAPVQRVGRLRPGRRRSPRPREEQHPRLGRAVRLGRRRHHPRPHRPEGADRHDPARSALSFRRAQAVRALLDPRLRSNRRLAWISTARHRPNFR